MVACPHLYLYIDPGYGPPPPPNAYASSLPFSPFPFLPSLAFPPPRPPRRLCLPAFPPLSVLASSPRRNDGHDGTATRQSVETSITAFRAPKFRQIRAALVETDGPTQVLNFVMFPHPR